MDIKDQIQSIENINRDLDCDLNFTFTESYSVCEFVKSRIIGKYHCILNTPINTWLSIGEINKLKGLEYREYMTNRAYLLWNMKKYNVNLTGAYDLFINDNNDDQMEFKDFIMENL